MIKVKNNILSREPIPKFLKGLAMESLADLSWTDPALGVSDCKWLPEVDTSPALEEYESYGAETLTLNGDHVTVVRAVVPWTQEEIAADIEAKRIASIPLSVSMRQACLALENAGILDDVEALVATLPRPYQIEWQRASTVERTNQLVEVVRQQQGMTVQQIDDMFILAETL